MEATEEIIIIDDDRDDQEVIALILKQLKVNHSIRFFDNAERAYEYLCDEKVIPFIIYSDINMPGMNGFQLRDKIHGNENIRLKCVPYLFLTTGGESRHIWEAYSKTAQGYFLKPNTLEGWKMLFSMTIAYWEHSKKPR